MTDPGTFEWLDYALAMANGANDNGRDFSLVSSRLEGLTLDGDVGDRLKHIAQSSPLMGEADVQRAARDLYGELARWLLEFMIAASYVRKEQGLNQEELSFAVGKWFSRLGEEPPVDVRDKMALSILVKGFLNDARPFTVACATPEGVRMVEAPLLVRVEHGRYYVTDEAENYLYHIDSTIDEFALDYSLVATRMGRELDSRSYDKSSHTVREMISRVGHVRRQMATLVEETGHLSPTEMEERYESIRNNVEAIRERGDDVQRYRSEVTRIWESWSSQDEMDYVRETRGERLSDLRALEDGLRVLTAVESWMIDDYATLSDRCMEVTRHYLRSEIVISLFSLDDLLDEVLTTDLESLEWLDVLMLPATKPEACVEFVIPPLVTIDEMMRSPKSEVEITPIDYGALGDELEIEADDEERRQVRDLAERFAKWLAAGGGSLAEWLEGQSPTKIYDDMRLFDLMRLVTSLLAKDVGKGVPGTEGRDVPPLESFSDAGWIREVLPGTGFSVIAYKDGNTVAYKGVSDNDAAAQGTIDNVIFEVRHDA